MADSNFIDVITQSATIIARYSTLALKSFEPNLYFDMIAQMISPPAQFDSLGKSAVFPIYGQVAENTSPLNTTNTSIAPTTKTTKSLKTVTYAAYGDHAVIETLQLPLESLINEVMQTSDILGDQAGRSIDLLARAAFDENTGANYCSNSSGQPFGAGAYPLKTKDVQKAFVQLQKNNVPRVEGNLYLAIAAPQVVADLRSQTGQNAWRTPKEYLNSPELQVAGEIGAWEGFRWLVTSQVKTFNTGTQFTTYFVGREAIGRAIQSPFRALVTRYPNAHNNLLSVAWDIIAGWKEIRPEALYKIRSTSNY